LTTLRKIALILGLVIAVVLALVFAYNNPQRIAIDLGFMRLDDVPAPLAFAVCLAIGWLFGLLSASAAVVRVYSERRRLRRDLRLAEAEVKTLRALPLQDAD